MVVEALRAWLVCEAFYRWRELLAGEKGSQSIGGQKEKTLPVCPLLPEMGCDDMMRSPWVVSKHEGCVDSRRERGQGLRQGREKIAIDGV